MHHLEGSASRAAVFLRTAKIESNYGALPSAKLYTVIYQIGRLFTPKKLTKADILLFQLNFSDRKYSYQRRSKVKFASYEDTQVPSDLPCFTVIHQGVVPAEQFKPVQSLSA